MKAYPNTTDLIQGYGNYIFNCHIYISFATNCFEIGDLPALWDKTLDNFCLDLVPLQMNQMSLNNISRNPSCILEVALLQFHCTCMLQYSAI